MGTWNYAKFLKKKTNGGIPGKRTNKEKDKWKDRQALKSADFLSLHDFVRILNAQEHN